MLLRLISLAGLFTFIGLAWLMSSDRRRISPRIVAGGILLQFAFALLILKTTFGNVAFQAMGDFFTTVIGYVDAGSAFMFNVHPRGDETGLPATFTLLRSFAFGVLPTIVFFSSLMSILYYLGIMQWVVSMFARVMQKTLGTSGAESLSAAANIFVGQTEAPLVVRPYVEGMTVSELNAVMVGGFATIAGGVLAAYVAMGVSAGHLITASVISAPAALLISKVMHPETERPKTMGKVDVQVTTKHVNLIEAAAAGASDGMKLAINVAAMLIAFLALIAMLNGFIGWAGHQVAGAASEWKLETGLGILFYPFAWLMGIPGQDCALAGEMLGLKLMATEFVAYGQLSDHIAGTREALSPRTVMILTYGLSGFANFGSIGIQIGGIGGIAPGRRADLARLGLRAMIGGTLAAFMTACVAGVLLGDSSDGTGQFAQIGGEYRLRTRPDQKKHGFTNRPLRRVPLHKTSALGSCQTGLCDAKYEGIGPLADRFGRLRCGWIGHRVEESEFHVGQNHSMFGGDRFDDSVQVRLSAGFFP